MAPTPTTFGGPLTVTSGTTLGMVPQAERLSLQNEASNLVNLIAQAHERLDRLTSAGQANSAPTPALPSLSASIGMATGDAGRLIQRLEELCERVGQI